MWLPHDLIRDIASQPATDENTFKAVQKERGLTLTSTGRTIFDRKRTAQERADWDLECDGFAKGRHESSLIICDIGY
jgi:hypothetical protein